LCEFPGIINNWLWRIKDIQATRPWVVTLAVFAVGLVLIIGLLIRARRGRKKVAPKPEDPAKKRQLGKGKYEFRLCIIGQKHRWIKTRGDSLQFTFKDPVPSTNPMDVLLDEQFDSYEIDPRVLYEVDPTFIQNVSWTLRGIHSVFLVVFRKGHTKPVKYESPKRSAYVLKTVEESQALSQALKKEFAGDFSLKKFFMYLVLLCVAIVLYLLLTGKLTI